MMACAATGHAPDTCQACHAATHVYDYKYTHDMPQPVSMTTSTSMTCPQSMSTTTRSAFNTCWERLHSFDDCKPPEESGHTPCPSPTHAHIPGARCWSRQCIPVLQRSYWARTAVLCCQTKSGPACCSMPRYCPTT